MCQCSKRAERTRDAARGERLVVTQSPHEDVNWVTAPGDPATVICLKNGTVLSVEITPGQVRGARFEEDGAPDDHYADSLVYLDGRGESVFLHRLPLEATLQVLDIPVETMGQGVFEKEGALLATV